MAAVDPSACYEDYDAYGQDPDYYDVEFEDVAEVIDGAMQDYENSIDPDGDVPFVDASCNLKQWT